jgi:formylmethanofuran dehydrogenase subunit E
MENKIKNRFEKIEGRVEKIENFIESGLSKKGRLVKCDKCGNSWVTHSKKQKTSCTNCGNKTPIEELVKCFKCKKYLRKSQAKFGYNEFFHPKCFNLFDKEAKREVDKMIGSAEKEGQI